VAIVGLATWTDVHRREVPAWLSLGAITGGLFVGVMLGQGAPEAALLGLVAGALPLTPFVALGAFGVADLLLLAVIGTWEGWAFVLRVAWWMGVPGALLAIVARQRGSRTMPYAPAIAMGLVAAFLFPLTPL